MFKGCLQAVVTRKNISPGRVQQIQAVFDPLGDVLTGQ